MSFEDIRTFEILRIDGVQLYRTENEKATKLEEGTLVVLYYQQHDWYILKINNWNYGLNKNVPLLASQQENDSIRTYVVADNGGYFAIKIPNAHYGDIENLDTILKHHTQFAFKENSNGHGVPVKFHDETVKIKRVLSTDDIEPASQPFNAAHTVYSGGKKVKETLINTAEVISVNLGKFGDYLQRDVIAKGEEKQFDPKTLRRMKWLNSATGKVSAVTSFTLKGLMSISKTISEKLEAKFEEKKLEQEATEAQEENAALIRKQKKEEFKSTGNLAHASIHAGIGLWHGMLESLDIIREGFTRTTTDVISHSYGQGAGELFEAGVGIVGNVGLPGKRYFKAVSKQNTITKKA